MTVGELIIELQKFPQDKKVFCYGMEIDTIKEVNDYPIGDTNNPNCKYEDIIYLE